MLLDEFLTRADNGHFASLAGTHNLSTITVEALSEILQDTHLTLDYAYCFTRPYSQLLGLVILKRIQDRAWLHEQLQQLTDADKFREVNPEREIAN
jgi:hypothetical protein